MNVDWSYEKNGFTLKKTKCRRFPVETKTDAGYEDDQALFANTSVQVDFLLYSLKQTSCISFYVNVDKTDFTWNEVISTLNG